MQRSTSRNGFTILEIMFAVSVLAVGLVGLLSVILHLGRLNAINRENLAAMRAAEKMVETLRNTEFDQVFPSYNGLPADDPAPGPGTAPGPHFDVPGLVPQAGDADRKCGRILFPADATGAGLLETTSDPELMMPRDLNENGVVEPVPILSDFKLLPVTVRIEWQGISGPRTLVYRALLLKK